MIINYPYEYVFCDDVYSVISSVIAYSTGPEEDKPGNPPSNYSTFLALLEVPTA